MQINKPKKPNTLVQETLKGNTFDLLTFSYPAPQLLKSLLLWKVYTVNAIVVANVRAKACKTTI